MAPLRCRLFAFALGCFVMAGALRAAGWVVPPIDGELSGEFTAIKLEGAPTLRWTIAARAKGAGARDFNLKIEGTGTRLVVRGVIDVKGNGTWSIVEGKLEAAQWFPSAQTQIGEMAAGVAVTGTVEMSGGGVIDAGASRGVMRIEWKDGGVRHEADGWTLEGVSFAGEFAIDTEKGTIESTLPLSVVVQTMTTARFGARGLAVIARLNADRTLAVEEARIEIAGGEVTADPTTVALTPMASELNLRITNVGLQDVAALVPSGLLESRGRINGAVRVGWSEAGGFKLGEGNLVLEQTEPAMVRLAPTPGFLTAQITERVPLLPASFGPLARWTSLRNPAFEEIRDIELGRTGLQIESLSVQLSPQGDRDGRTARVRMTGRPARPDSVVGAVTFEVNVAGPLSEVLRLGMNQSFSVETR